jgi:hypothetical protein
MVARSSRLAYTETIPLLCNYTFDGTRLVTKVDAASDPAPVSVASRHVTFDLREIG